MTARELVNTYGDMIYRICLVSLKNHADAEDATQEIFLKYLTRAPAFSSPDHEKAWLITVTVNQCRNMLRSQKLIPTDPELLHPPDDPAENHAVLDALLKIPEKFRTVLMLYYIYGYKINEIAKMIGTSASAVKMRLSKGRKLLADLYRKEYLP